MVVVPYRPNLLGDGVHELEVHLRGVPAMEEDSGEDSH